jgi:hypothetical protein
VATLGFLKRLSGELSEEALDRIDETYMGQRLAKYVSQNLSLRVRQFSATM